MKLIAFKPKQNLHFYYLMGSGAYLFFFVSDRFKGNLSFTKSVCTVTVPQPAKRLTKVLREDKEGLKGGRGGILCTKRSYFGVVVYE